MMEDDMKRNGSGYYDETPIKTGLFSSGPQPGEIWETKLGKEYLILKNHGAFCNVLALHDTANYTDPVEVVSRSIKYTNPALMCYCFNTAWPLAGYIKTIPEEQYLDIMQAVGERLGVTIRVSAESKIEDKVDRKDFDKAVKDFCEEERNSRRIIENLQAERDEACAAREYLISRCDGLERELNMKIDDNLLMRDTRERAEEKAAMWEKMYNALLDRLFARGEAK